MRISFIWSCSSFTWMCLHLFVIFSLSINNKWSWFIFDLSFDINFTRRSSKDFCLFNWRSFLWIFYASSSSSLNSPNLLLTSEGIAVTHQSDIFQHKVSCHVFNKCVQNAKTVISILRHIFLCLQQQHLKLNMYISDQIMLAVIAVGKFC
jgi:hypothetical protein